MRGPSSLGIVALALLGCNGDPPAAPVPDLAAPPAPDLTSRGGDAMPPGAIAFFKTPLCPNGWFPYGPAAGRALLPTMGPGAVGDVQGEPLGDGEDRRHDHKITARLEPRSVSFAGVAGEANHGVASAAAVSAVGAADPASSGLPYLQLLVCQKNAAARPGRRPLPRGALAFFAQSACPDGWVQAGATQGRMLVGLPERGALDATFGGAPLGPADGGAGPERRAHGHGASGSVSLPGHGIALVSGCCASGYAGSGDYSYSAAGEPAAAALPYLQLLQCQKL